MQNRKRSLNYPKALVICHGKTELIITRYIKSNLHISAETHAKDNGSSSLQITRLVSELQSSIFADIDSFSKHFGANVIGKGKNKRLSDDFKVFIIMDTDDCTDSQKQDFVSKKMFSGHWLYKYIEPIYSTPNIDKVLYKAKVVTRIVRDDEKGTFYSEVFPLCKGDVTSGTVKEIQDFSDSLRKRKDTNFYLLPDFFLACLPKKTDG